MSVRRAVTRTAAAAGMASALALAPTAPVLAAPSGEVVSGLLSPDAAGSCTDAHDWVAAFTAAGSLVGCWYVDTFVVDHGGASGTFLSHGTETFVGCLDTRCGRFFTTYTFTAKVVDGVETHGRCHHPVVGGTGGFAGAKGEISMHDLPDGCSTYHGRLSF